MSLRERAVHLSLHNPPFGGRSSLKEALLTVGRKLRNEPVSISAPRPEKVHQLHVRAGRREGMYRSGMAMERIWGWSRTDLGFAVRSQVVSLGDVLEVTNEYIDFDRNRPVHEIKEVIYLDSDSLKGDNPPHRFLDPQSKELPTIITFGDNIVHWKKTGTLPDSRKDSIKETLQLAAEPLL